MGSVEQWVPGAIQAVAAMGQLYLGIADHRLRQAETWGNTVQELTQLEPEELRRVIEDNPAAAELVGQVFEAATRTGSEDKRYILARVAAAALSGDTTPEKIDRLQFLARPVIALDPPHITLLVLIGETSRSAVIEASHPDLDPERVRRRMKNLPVEYRQFVDRWPGGQELVDPAIAALVREGLVSEPKGGGHTGEEARCALLPFGVAFLDYLLIEAGGWPPTHLQEIGQDRT